MTRGRKPKPTQLKIIEGNAGGRPLNDKEPIPKGDLDEAPDWLSETQKESWRYAIEHAPARLLKKIDSNMLAIWVVAEDTYKKAAKAVTETDLIVRSPVKGELMQNPYLAIMNKQSLILMKASSELGFTPSSRSRIQVEEANEQADNPFAEFKRTG